jgi:hypothetical protein
MVPSPHASALAAAASSVGTAALPASPDVANSSVATANAAPSAPAQDRTWRAAVNDPLDWAAPARKGHGRKSNNSSEEESRIGVWKRNIEEAVKSAEAGAKDGAKTEEEGEAPKRTDLNSQGAPRMVFSTIGLPVEVPGNTRSTGDLGSDTPGHETPMIFA